MSLPPHALPTATIPAPGEAPRVRTRLTRLGRGVALATLAVAGAGYNTGNNLLFLLLSALLVYFAFSWWLSRRAVRGVRVSAGPFAGIHAGQETPVRVEATAAGPGLAAPLLRVSFRGGVESGGAVFPWIPAGGTEQAFPRVRFPRRGSWPAGLVVSSDYPAGLLESRVERDDAARVLAWPALGDAEGLPPPGSGAWGEDPVASVGWGVDLLNLREYQSGEDARAIDWKSTARAGRPIIRVTAREQERVWALVVDPSAGRPGDEEARARAEGAISRAATAAVELVRRGHRVRLILPEEEVGGARGTTDPRTLLDALALLPLAEPPLPLHWWAASARPGERVLTFRAAQAGPGGAEGGPGGAP